jgi:chemotaxis methyl-accepting protein methylase
MSDLLNAGYVFFRGVCSIEPLRIKSVASLPPTAQAPRVFGSEEFFDVLLRKMGLPANAYRAGSLHRRIPACLRFLGVRDVTAALSRLEKSPQLAASLLNVVLLGVTEFWRDIHVFERLEELLPSGPLSIWSAGCSDGQELYSVAMLLAERGQLGRAELLGTDFRPDAVSLAKEGRYPMVVAARLDDARRRQFFGVDDQGARIVPELREKVSWKKADLLTGVEPGPWDVVLWRNMAIYLEPDAALRIWTGLSGVLKPGGLLVTGKAEQPPSHLELIRLGACIYQKP